MHFGNNLGEFSGQLAHVMFVFCTCDSNFGLRLKLTDVLLQCSTFSILIKVRYYLMLRYFDKVIL